MRGRRTKRTLLSARLLETSFGFTSEDGFECGPLNVVPDMPKMKALRERWEARLSARRTLQEEAPPSLGLVEDVDFHVFPREMTVSAELALRGAYLEISCKLLRESYGEAGDSLRGDQAPVRERPRRVRGDHWATSQLITISTPIKARATGTKPVRAVTRAVRKEVR